MPKATPSKADLPKAPPRVREIKDEALMVLRVAEYNWLYAIYEEDTGRGRRSATKKNAAKQGRRGQGGS